MNLLLMTCLMSIISTLHHFNDVDSCNIVTVLCTEIDVEERIAKVRKDF